MHTNGATFKFIDFDASVSFRDNEFVELKTSAAYLPPETLYE